MSLTLTIFFLPAFNHFLYSQSSWESSSCHGFILFCTGSGMSRHNEPFFSCAKTSSFSRHKQRVQGNELLTPEPSVTLSYQ